MSSSQPQRQEAAPHDEAKGVRKAPAPAKSLTWHQIVEWSDEDLARWRDAHKRQRNEPVS